MPSVAWKVTGRVQGVGFRWWTRSQALGLEIVGTVANCPDGSVEIRAAGSDEALSRLRDLVSEGPPLARVDDVEVMDAPDIRESEFHVLP